MSERAAGRVGVIGLGLIGGSIAQRLAQAGNAVIAFDSDERSRAAATAAGVLVADSIAAVAGSADHVFVAVPPAQTARVVCEVLAADDDVLVTDVASVKAPIAGAVSAEMGDSAARFLPSHPLAGSESSGWGAARPDLLEATVWAVCPPSSDAPIGPLCSWSRLLDAFDARLVVCDPAAHDAAVARTSHAPHVLAAIVATPPEAGTASLEALLSGGALRDMTRIARADPALWSEIVTLNADAVGEVLEHWIDALGALRKAAAGGDGAAIADAVRRGAAALAEVDARRWSAPRWTEQRLRAPFWEALTAIGAAGRVIRRVRENQTGIVFDVSG